MRRFVPFLAILLVALFLMGHISRWSGRDSQSTNFFIFYRVSDPGVVAPECFPRASVTYYYTSSGLSCTHQNVYMFVPAKHQLLIRGLSGVVHASDTLEDAGEDCDVTLQAGDKDDLVAIDDSIMLEVGPNSSPSVSAAGEMGITEAALLLDEGDWFRMSFVDGGRSTCTSVVGATFTVIGTLSRKP